ncbi:MAG TPA: glucoamylase family protein, partial [Gemmatimonadota bacterium]|nr:glucoamylase family protein [Gemmatimonadota bacterium]
MRKVQAEQVATHATVGNVVTSMRQIAAYDWATFFESVSLVEWTLRKDPAGVYARMDFATRDLYRHAVEELARGADLSEIEVARAIVARSGEVAERDPAGRNASSAHVGYHLIRDGRRQVESDLGYRVPIQGWLKRAFISFATPGYLGTITLVTALLMALLLVYLARLDVDARLLVALGLLALVPATDLAIAVIHRDLNELLEPRRLPKLDFSRGVPAEHRTLVAVPALLASEDEIAELVDSLERHYLANPEADLTLALLSDWKDAESESLPEDDRLLAAAARGLSELNEQHGPAGGGTPRFLLLHRQRTWNPREGRWMGWERKRGKIHELNRLLRGIEDTSFVERADGLSDVPAGVRYVITLDADTRLPSGSAARLVGALAHPLNRPRFDLSRDRVVDGYGVLQPRVTPLLPRRGETTPYHRLYAGPTGIDPYSSAVSDVYQDLFGEGSYVGKGIYDVDAFEAALTERVPDNAILSHDLFEGTFARCGSVTDVELFDDFPSDYVSDARRAHRWARGDWQRRPWILGRGPREATRKTRDLRVVARWKMIDNLRRTLSPPSTFVLLVVGWALLPISPLLWTGFVVATIAMPAAVPVFTGLMPRRRGIAKRSHVRAVVADANDAVARVLLAVVFVADRTVRMVDAIARALVRTYVTGRHKLEWVTAAQAREGVPRDAAAAYRAFGWSVALAIASGAFVAAVRLEALSGAAPVILLWVLSPLLALLLGRPLRARVARLEPRDVAFLRLVARRTWAYFEAMVGDDGLPPDNLQMDPAPVVARRTSPTNVGTYLLSVLAARDLGWIGTDEMIERLERTLTTVDRLERYHGHLYNWYDTESLGPLQPRYVSTVDSGNLAGHLWAVAQGCRDLAELPPVGPRALAGVADALALARLAAERVEPELPVAAVSATDLRQALSRVEERLDPPPADDGEWAERLASLAEAASSLLDIALAGREARGNVAWEELVTWAQAVRSAAASHARDLAAADGSAEGCPPALADGLRRIAARADAHVEAMDFAFLYNRERKLFPIGYRVEEGGFDTGYYDLLASEARLASFIAIAKGDVPVEHWFHLGRSITPVGRDAALVSWSGSMFEYLMPALVLEPPPSTMLERTQRLVLERQIRYGAERGVPWGISESAYNARDRELTYQYSHFGIPGLGLTRGLVDDLVVAPYATALGAMIDPLAARRNFQRLAEEGGLGPLGYYEALDYTPARVPDGEELAVVRAYMTHHQG